MGPMPAWTGRSLTDRLAAGVRSCQDLPSLAGTVCATLRRDVPFTFGCLATTDPLTGLITWTFKTDPLEIGDEQFAAIEYGRPDVNRFTDLANRQEPVGVLSLDTGGQPQSCHRFHEFLQPRFGFTDELRAAFRSEGMTWGVLALYRGPGGPAFSRQDAATLASVHELVAEAIRGLLFTGQPGTRHTSTEPAIIIVDSRGQPVQMTQTARERINELGGWDKDSLPTNLLSVAAHARTSPQLARAHARTSTGRWLTLRATTLGEPAESANVVITIDATPRAELSQVALAAAGLTQRELDVSTLVLQGASTRDIAHTLYLSPHTVQDHLKAVFAKLGVSSRREMIAKLIVDY